jgi:hypothetical protein
MRMCQSFTETKYQVFFITVTKFAISTKLTKLLMSNEYLNYLHADFNFK